MKNTLIILSIGVVTFLVVLFVIRLRDQAFAEGTCLQIDKHREVIGKDGIFDKMYCIESECNWVAYDDYQCNFWKIK